MHKSELSISYLSRKYALTRFTRKLDLKKNCKNKAGKAVVRMSFSCIGKLTVRM